MKTILVDAIAEWAVKIKKDNPGIGDEGILEKRAQELESHGCEASKWMYE